MIGLFAASAVALPATASTNSVLRARSAWTVVHDATGARITWHGTAPLPIGGARVEVRRGGAVIGIAREVGSDAVLDLGAAASASAAVVDASGLELWRSGRRIDLASPAQRAPVATGEPTAPEPSAPAATAADPGAPGPYATERLEYHHAGFLWPEYPVPIEMLGEVTAPTGAPGARPFVLILHGRHGTCFTGGPGGFDSGDWPCPAGWKAIPSYLGYRVTADLLASQGYIVVSIAANGINGQDFLSADGGAAARSALIRRHLALWAKWNRTATDPWGGRFQGRVNLSKVVLIGHSRGGEGVARAAIDSNPSDPWKIRGLVMIGPTAFGQQIPTDVQTAVLLPYCDGDVSDLQGQIYVDGGRNLLAAGDPSLRSAVMVMGANHNFFNSEWTPGLAHAPAIDDWLYSGAPDDPRCGLTSPHRLSALTQEAVGATYSAALVRLALENDPSMREYLDSPAPSPPSAGGAEVHVTAIGADRSPIYEAGTHATAKVTATGLVHAGICLGYSFTLPTSCSTGFLWNGTPHWIAPYTAIDKPAPKALELTWTGAGTVRLQLAKSVDLHADSSIDLRVALDPRTDPTEFGVRAVDADGNVATLPDSGTVVPMPGGKRIGKVWARDLRASLTGVTGIDETRIVAVELVTPGASGHGFLLDAMAVRDRLPKVPATGATRADVATVDVIEGNTPGQHVEVPVTLDPAPAHGGRVWVEIAGLDATVGHVQTIAPGATSFFVTVTYDGDTQPFGDRFIGIAIFGLSNVTTGQYLGGVRIHDDD